MCSRDGPGTFHSAGHALYFVVAVPVLRAAASFLHDVKGRESAWRITGSLPVDRGGGADARAGVSKSPPLPRMIPSSSLDKHTHLSREQTQHNDPNLRARHFTAAALVSERRGGCVLKVFV